jgi:hypothetical protein
MGVWVSVRVMKRERWVMVALGEGLTAWCVDGCVGGQVNLGQQLMKDIYEALRASPDWESTLFIITYDGAVPPRPLVCIGMRSIQIKMGVRTHVLCTCA